MAFIKIRDLSLSGDEPRVLDVKIAAALGMARATNIRATIEAHAEELRSYGNLHAARAKSAGRGRPALAYHLNEPQALLLCMWSNTPTAAAVRRQLIDAFMAVRRGEAPAVPALPSPRRRRLSPAQVAEMRSLWEAGSHDQEALAARFGVSRPHVSRVVNYQRHALASGGMLAAVQMEGDILEARAAIAEAKTALARLEHRFRQLAFPRER